jgi:hypothetical protein
MMKATGMSPDIADLYALFEPAFRSAPCSRIRRSALNVHHSSFIIHH